MGIKRSLTVAAAIAAALLIPVLVIISLGIYGESIGAPTTESANGEPTLSLQPDRGPSDSPVLIQGQGWPPRSEISLFLGESQSADTGRVPEVTLATITTSSTGSFEIQLRLPPSLFTVDADSVRIRGAIQPADGRPPAGASIQFSIQPYPNLVTVTVVDAETGGRLDGAEVLVKDSFGTVLASGRTDAAGIAEFAGITPGRAAAEVRRLDYRGARVKLSIPSTGPTRATVPLTADPDKRLLLPFDVIVDTDHLRIMALDRASGLRADEIVNRQTAGQPFPAEIHFFYLLPTGDTGTPPDNLADAPTLGTMRAWGLRFIENLRAIVARVTLLGLSAGGDVVLVTEATGAGFGSGSSTWLLLDPDTSGLLLYLLTAGAGGVYRVDLATHDIPGSIVSVTGATWLTTNGAGTRLYLVGPAWSRPPSHPMSTVHSGLEPPRWRLPPPRSGPISTVRISTPAAVPARPSPSWTPNPWRSSAAIPPRTWTRRAFRPSTDLHLSTYYNPTSTCAPAPTRQHRQPVSPSAPSSISPGRYDAGI